MIERGTLVIVKYPLFVYEGPSMNLDVAFSKLEKDDVAIIVNHTMTQNLDGWIAEVLTRFGLGWIWSGNIADGSYVTSVQTR